MRLVVCVPQLLLHPRYCRGYQKDGEEMSIIFLVIFISLLKGIVDPSEINAEFFYYWALFAISDALWFDLLFGKRALSHNSSISISTSKTPRCEWLDANGIRKSKCSRCHSEFGRVMGDDCKYCPTCGAKAVRNLTREWRNSHGL